MQVPDVTSLPTFLLFMSDIERDRAARKIQAAWRNSRRNESNEFLTTAVRLNDATVHAKLTVFDSRMCNSYVYLYVGCQGGCRRGPQHTTGKVMCARRHTFISFIWATGGDEQSTLRHRSRMETPCLQRTACRTGHRPNSWKRNIGWSLSMGARRIRVRLALAHRAPLGSTAMGLTVECHPSFACSHTILTSCASQGKSPIDPEGV